MTGSNPAAITRIATNRKAFHDYTVLERRECGIELRGTEVKSIRAGHISLVGAFARVEGGSVVLQNVTVQPYPFGNRFNHDPLRPRRLLLHRREIARLGAQTAQKGMTLIPLAVYLKHGLVKIELGVCRGKQRADKRETLRRRTAEREAERAMARGRASPAKH